MNLIVFAIILWALGYLLLYGASKFREHFIDSGFHTFSLAIFYHFLWAIGWSLIVLGFSLIFFSINFFLFQWIGYLFIALFYVLLVLGGLPFIFGWVVALFVGYFSNEIGNIPIINKYFREVHDIHWHWVEEDEYFEEAGIADSDQKTNYAQTNKNALVARVKFNLPGEMKVYCEGKRFDILEEREDEVVLDTVELLGYRTAFQMNEIAEE